jgi:hypothetical protein
VNFYHVTHDVGGKRRRFLLSECAHAVWGRVVRRRGVCGERGDEGKGTGGLDECASGL